MKITILGSTGFLGKVLLEKALKNGYQVKTMVRNPQKLGNFKDKVDFIQGDIEEPGKIEDAIKETSLVISTIGPPQKNPEKSTKI